MLTALVQNGGLSAASQNAVFNAALHISSDYTKRSDVERLLKMAKLDQPQTERVLGFVGNDMSGDYDKSQLLQALLKQGLIAAPLQPKFIAAASTMFLRPHP